MKDFLNATEVAVMVGVTVPTLNSWYKWKSENIDNPVANKLPDYVRRGNRNTRYWKYRDVPKIIEFRASLPKGRNGILGSVTQRYVKKGSKTNETIKQIKEV